MESRRGGSPGFLLALAAAVTFLGVSSCGSRSLCADLPSSHFYRTMYTGVSQPGQGLPRFMAAGYVDDQPIAWYDSDMRTFVPQISWMKKAGEENPKYFDWYSQTLLNDDYGFRSNLVMLRQRYNQSEGFHTVQMMIVCEVRKDGSRGGHWQYGYDGRDFLAFDVETSVWTAADMQAQVIKRKWESETPLVQRFRSYMEDICAEWMWKDQDYRKERLLRKEPPTVRVMRKPDYDGMETLICQAYGFYPQEIDATWTKDGEIWWQDTFRGVISPNSDGTYYTWLGIKVDPKERDRYQCHVEHDGLLEPLDLAWEEPASIMGLRIGSIVGAVLIVAAGIAGIAVRIRLKGKEEELSRAKSGLSQEPNEVPHLCLLLPDPKGKEEEPGTAPQSLS